MADVPLQEHVEALMEAERRVALVRQELANERHEGINRRLNESAHDRERIRNALGTFVPRAEYDRASGLLLERISLLERANARLLGGLGVIVVLLTVLGVALRYLVG